MQTRDQERARQAYNDIQEALKTLPDKAQGKYGPLVKKLPSYILTNGLGQTLAFLLSKGKQDPQKEHTLLYNQISRRISKDGKLIDEVMNKDSVNYRRLTAEALAYLNWLKRFAEGEPKLRADEQAED
jgi:CRISPR-associated protein Cmr5